MRYVQLLHGHDLTPLTEFSSTPLPIEGQRVLQRMNWHDLRLADAIGDSLPVNSAVLSPGRRPYTGGKSKVTKRTS